MQIAGKNFHFVGIKGIGLSALAQFFFFGRAKITGSDNSEEFPTDAVLKRLKIPLTSFSPKNISSRLDLVIYSSAYNKEQPEIKKALSLNIPAKSYGEILAEVFNQGENKILVAGSHGKTTTTALLGHLLAIAGYQPTVFVGGLSNNWQSNFKKGKNKWLVAEGDEYQKKFLFLKPDYLLITNIDFDHPDCFKNPKEYRRAFEELKKQTKNPAPEQARCGAGKIFTGKKISENFRKFLEKIDFPLLGEKNKENAYLVYRLAKELNIPDKKIRKAFETFKGVKRRMEIIKKFKIQNSKFKILVIDDYAHHPEEIKATLAALKEKYPDYKLLTIFQPHTYSRTKALLKDFGRCFQKADFVYLLPTFSSAREKKPKENIDKLLFEEVKKHHPQVKSNISTYEVDILKKRYEKLIILTLGAGDVYKIAEKLTS